MQSPNSFIVAAAGCGKTTRIVREATAAADRRVLLTTYTLRNRQEIKTKFYEHAGGLPGHVEIESWYSFLLHELARPYQRDMYPTRINGIHFVQGQSPFGISASNIRAFYFSSPDQIYSDKIAKFVCECDRRSGGAIMRRLRRRFDQIYIDEMQDLSGYDLDLVELILRSGITVTMIGDHRQATFKTNHATKNKAYSGSEIIRKLELWSQAGLGVLSFDQQTRRCIQGIADVADALFPAEPATLSLNKTLTGHDGVFVIRTVDVEAYIGKYAPQVLRLDSKTGCGDRPALNFGESNGLTFDRVLIFPHGKGRDWIKTGDQKHINAPITKMKIYVGVTRARQSVAFVFDGAHKLGGVSVHDPS